MERAYTLWVIERLLMPGKPRHQEAFTIYLALGM